MAEIKKSDMKLRVQGRRAVPQRAAGRVLERPARFLADNGILGHINLRVLHPVGLSMEACPDGVTFFVRDHRAQPFDTYTRQEYRDETERWDRFLEQGGASTMATRREGLGYIIQRDQSSDRE